MNILTQRWTWGMFLPGCRDEVGAAATGTFCPESERSRSRRTILLGVEAVHRNKPCGWLWSKRLAFDSLALLNHWNRVRVSSRYPVLRGYLWYWCMRDRTAPPSCGVGVGAQLTFFVIRRIYLIYYFIFTVKFACNDSQENLKSAAIKVTER